jgi:hypothetical protein
MFGLSIVDHVRLNLARTAENYTVHARAAERLALLTTRIRIGVLVVTLVAAAAAVASAIAPGPVYRMVAAGAAAVAFACYAASIAFGFEGRVYAHRLCAHNLWLVCERHRALMAEIRDGSIDRASVIRRRDELVLETHRAYDQMFPLDELGFERARQFAETGERPDSDGTRGDVDARPPSAMQTHHSETEGSLPLTG